ncbi:MAG: ATPase, T2SS/T4P/T4SS family [Pseudomonadota bacterium]|nr:ATPase, T2SS/T4P/T4SS family [Pseudomonadota bacterium]
MKKTYPIIRYVNELPDFEKIISGSGDKSVIKLAKDNETYIVFETDEKKVFIVVSMDHVENFEEFQIDLLSRLRDKGYELVDRNSSKISQIYQADISLIKEIYSDKQFGQEIDNNLAKELFKDLLMEAVDMNTNDIHIAIFPSQCEIKFKVDGRTQEYQGDHRYSRLNVEKMIRAMYNTESVPGSRSTNDDFSLDLYLDSKMNVELPELKKNIEVRFQSIPIVPSSSKVTLRLAGVNSSDQMSLEDVYEDTHVELFELISKSASGATFFTGMTGSGKTTSMHKLIDLVSEYNPGSIINSVEDPVEIVNPNVYQSQLELHEGEDKGAAYVKALGAMLRSDIDFIVQGEIRSQEQAEVNAHAILTGHGLFTTLHTIGAIPALMRLNELGISYFTLGSISFLNAIIYQRLYSKVCPKCSTPLSPNEDKDMIDNLLAIDPKMKIESIRKINPKGCDHCSNKGFKGRVLCAEILVPDEHGRLLIQEGKINELQHYWLKEQNFDFLKGKYKGRSFLDHVLHKMQSGVLCPYEGQKQWRSFAFVTKEMRHGA